MMTKQGLGKKLTVHDVNTAAARKALLPLWDQADARGRLSGIVTGKGGNNPFARTNTTIIIGDEAISVVGKRDGTIIVHHFKLVKTTGLGEEAVRLLKSAGLTV